MAITKTGTLTFPQFTFSYGSWAIRYSGAARVYVTFNDNRTLKVEFKKEDSTYMTTPATDGDSAGIWSLTYWTSIDSTQHTIYFTGNTWSTAWGADFGHDAGSTHKLYNATNSTVYTPKDGNTSVTIYAHITSYDKDNNTWQNSDTQSVTINFPTRKIIFHRNTSSSDDGVVSQTCTWGKRADNAAYFGYDGGYLWGEDKKPNGFWQWTYTNHKILYWTIDVAGQDSVHYGVYQQINNWWILQNNSADVDLYAQWELTLVQFTINGLLDLSTSSSTFNYGHFTLYLNNEHIDDDLVSFSRQVNPGTTYSITTYANSGKVFYGDTSKLTGTINSDTTISLDFRTTYTIGYSTGYSGGTAPANQTKIYGVNLTLRPAITRNSAVTSTITSSFYNSDSTLINAITSNVTTSYTFKEWKAQNNTTYSGSGTYTANAAAVLTAQWNSTNSYGSITVPKPSKVLTRTVTLNSQMSDISTSTLTSTNTLVYKGYYTATSGGTQLIGTSTTTLTPTTSKSYYAQFTDNSAWTSVILPTLSKENYTFLGWSTDATANTGVIGAYTPPSDIILYGIWYSLADTYCYINNTYKKGKFYVYTNNNWVEVIPYVYNNGIWKKG